MKESFLNKIASLNWLNIVNVFHIPKKLHILHEHKEPSW